MIEFNPTDWSDFVGIESPEDLVAARAQAIAWLWNRLEYRCGDAAQRRAVREAIEHCRELGIATITPRPSHYRPWQRRRRSPSLPSTGQMRLL